MALRRRKRTNPNIPGWKNQKPLFKECPWEPGEIRKLREHLHWTQLELSIELGCKRETISVWENAHQKPRRGARWGLTRLALEYNFPYPHEIDAAFGRWLMDDEKIRSLDKRGARKRGASVWLWKDAPDFYRLPAPFPNGQYISHTPYDLVMRMGWTNTPHQNGLGYPLQQIMLDGSLITFWYAEEIKT